jgi:hypothetical protein
MLLICIREIACSNLGRGTYFHSFPQSYQVDAGIALQIMSWPLPPTSFPIYMPPIKLSNHLILSGIWCCAWVIDEFWIGWLDLLTPYTFNSGLQAITALPLISALYRSPLHTPSLVLSWQRISNILVIPVSLLTAPHMKSSFHSLIPFSPFPLNQIRLPTLSIRFFCSQAHNPCRLASRNSTNSNDLLCPFYNPSAWTTPKTEPLYCWDVFTAPLHSNENYSIVACVFVAAEYVYRAAA